MGWADIDAAIAEVEQEEFGFEWRGRRWRCRPLPARLVRAFGLAVKGGGDIELKHIYDIYGDDMGVVQAILATDELRAEFEALDPDLHEIAAIADNVARIYGFGPGESKPSVGGSKSAGRGQKRSSPRPTGKTSSS